MQEEVSIINTTIFRRPTCEKESWNLSIEAFRTGTEPLDCLCILTRRAMALKNLQLSMTGLKLS